MNTSQSLRPGTEIYKGDYRIVRVIGRGGFGITYLGVMTNLGKYVAIKEFYPQGMYNRDENSGYATVSSPDNEVMADKLKGKFLKEARRLANLRHDSIVPVSNAFEENGTAYYVMDFIEGSDLQTIVREDGPLSLGLAIGYIRQVGEALEYLHSRRINHLDVKPANILVDPAKNRAVLIDFGLSKQYDENDHQTSTTPVGVSRGYAPIEQYKSGGVQEFSAPTDVYALGATLYYLLTGLRPPEATDLGEESLTIPPTVPSWLRPVLLKAMAYRRIDRYPTISALLNALNVNKSDNEATAIMAQADDDPIEIDLEPAPVPKPSKPAKKRRGWALNILIAFLLISIGIVIFCVVYMWTAGGDSPGVVCDTVYEDETEYPNYAEGEEVEAPAEEAAYYDEYEDAAVGDVAPIDDYDYIK